MHSQMSSVVSVPTPDTGKELLVLSDEQILDIAPEVDSARTETRSVDQEPSAVAARSTLAASPGEQPQTGAAKSPSSTGHESTVTGHDSAEPPAWLAAQMQDPWGGEEAREFWDGVQQARTEAAAYRAAIASPEDARALKELYPGGVSEARTAAERARLLDEVDRAYFGAAGNSPEQLSASRAQLAQRMLREDPAAFREMVEAGIRVLQEAAAPQTPGAKSLASAVAADTRNDPGSANTSAKTVGTQHVGRRLGNHSANQAHVAAYAAFERAANEDLERSVGGAIERTLAQALPAAERNYTPGQAGSQLYPERSRGNTPPLRERLATSVRADVEKALQGDRQLGEQVAQILAARRFDNESRGQIVRLISDRAQQLVPGAAKRVLNDWTQTTLAAHRGRTHRGDAASTRSDIPVVSMPAVPIRNDQIHTRRQDANAAKSKPINYRKLSDEQILEM